MLFAMSIVRCISTVDSREPFGIAGIKNANIIPISGNHRVIVVLSPECIVLSRPTDSILSSAADQGVRPVGSNVAVLMRWL
jgi:hypothetical protein